MRIERFKVERWMDEYEGFAKYNLGETCIDSLKLGELLDLCGKSREEFMDEIMGERLVYGWIHGSPDLKNGVANLYESLAAEDILPTHGGISANHMVLAELSESGKNMVTVVPTYQQHYSIPESLGVEVRKVWLKREKDFVLDPQDMREAVDKDTVLISICNPDNPTGAFVPKDVMEEIVAMAREVGAYIICDEAYRGRFEDGTMMYSVADLYEKGIATASMSKVFGLAGLRLGWVATRDKDLMDRLHGRRDYDTISCGYIDDILASLALANKEKIYERNEKIQLRGRETLDKWVSSTPGASYVKPKAGTTALVFYDADVPSEEFSAHLARDKGTLTVPGAAFDIEHSFRIGYAFSPDVLQQGLDVIAETLEEYK